MKNGSDNIAKAIRALPYRGPRAGFSARVMAAIAKEQSSPVAGLIGAAELLVAGWSALVAFAAAGLIGSNWTAIAAFLIQPGSFGRALDLASARCAMLAGKAVALLQLAADLAAAAPVPAWQEFAAAAFVSAAVIYTLSGRLAAQRI